jgi:hypothetical protein
MLLFDPVPVGRNLSVNHLVGTVVRGAIGIAAIGDPGEDGVTVDPDECGSSRIAMTGPVSVRLVEDHL